MLRSYSNSGFRTREEVKVTVKRGKDSQKFSKLNCVSKKKSNINAIEYLYCNYNDPLSKILILNNLNFKQF